MSGNCGASWRRRSPYRPLTPARWRYAASSAFYPGKQACECGQARRARGGVNTLVFKGKRHNDIARFPFILAINFRLGHFASAAGNRTVREIVGMGGSRRRNRLTACAQIVAWREWVCTMPPIVGNARYNRRWVGVSDDGLTPLTFNDFTALGLTTTISSAVMTI